LNPVAIALIPKQLEAVRAFSALPEAASLAAANKRIANILRQAESKKSEEHTSELQSLRNLVCRLLLEKKKTDVTQDLKSAEALADIFDFDAHEFSFRVFHYRNVSNAIVTMSTTLISDSTSDAAVLLYS